MSKLAVLFPGIGYTCDKPLLYYSRKLFTSLGYDIVACEYGGFPDGVRGNADKMKQCFTMALSQAEATLVSVDFHAYDEVVFVAKSVGTAVAGAFNEKYQVGARLIIMTPVVATFKYVTDDAIVFHGTSDPWAETPAVTEACERLNLPLILTEGANHSLETGDLNTDLATIEKTMQQISAWINRQMKAGC